MAPIIIAGTGLAGYTLAKEFRKLNKEQPLLMLTLDDGRNYSKPMLSTGFTKNKTPDQLAMADAETMAQQLPAEVKTGVGIAAIDEAAHTLELTTGETLEYSKLVLALGAEVVRLPFAGDGAADLISVNDLQDYQVFRDQLAGKQRVAILGGGLIGCEFANDLTNGGFSVTVIEPVGRPLPALLPAGASAAVEQGLKDIGVTFKYGEKVVAVDKIDTGYRLDLTGGETVEADLVVSAVGLKPRITLAKATGLTTNLGIQVDRTLRTSSSDIFALGDCAEIEGHVMLYVLPLMASARALAKTLAGTDTPVTFGPMPVMVKTPACPVVVAPVPPGTAGSWQEEVDGLNVTATFTSDSGQLMGFALTGEAVAQKNQLAKQLPPLLSP